jgi:predicted phosphoribosyltransferase
MLFVDRAHAGAELARHLLHYRGREDVVVLGLPRGGVPVAHEVARALDVVLDVFLVRKLGAPGQEELAIGAIGSGGVVFVNEPIVRALGLSREAIDAAAEREWRELERRERLYRADLPPLDVRDKSVILVDDGLATGSTVRAAAAALRLLGPRRIVVAVPVAAPETCAELTAEVDEVVCAETPSPFQAVGRFYRHFQQTTDAEVLERLRRAREAHPVSVAGAS